MSTTRAALYPGLIVYRVLLWLALPVVMLRLWLRSRRDPSYRPRWRERFGDYAGSSASAASAASENPPSSGGPIWFHTVSAGETIAAAPIIRAFIEGTGGVCGDDSVLVTTMTPTGSEQVGALLGETVVHCYAPYDFTFAVRGFLAWAKPRALILMETEIWPNLILEAKAQGIAVFLINARLSQKSAGGYRRFSWLGRPVLDSFDLIACQTPAHARRFADLGVDLQRLQVVGNVKYDLETADDNEVHKSLLKQKLGPHRERFWIAASTHPGEEEMVLAAHLSARQTVANLILLLAPRHPNRLAELTPLLDRMLKPSGAKWCRYSELLSGDGPMAPDTNLSVIVVDQMGVLMPLFSLADLAFVGGSLVPRGGHNPIEPASLSTPVLAGPHYFNFSQVYADLKEAEAFVLVSEETLPGSLLDLLGNKAKREAMGIAAAAVVEANRGATQRSIAVIEKAIMD